MYVRCIWDDGNVFEGNETKKFIHSYLGIEIVSKCELRNMFLNFVLFKRWNGFWNGLLFPCVIKTGPEFKMGSDSISL